MVLSIPIQLLSPFPAELVSITNLMQINTEETKRLHLSIRVCFLSLVFTLNESNSLFWNHTALNLATNLSHINKHFFKASWNGTVIPYRK